MEDLVSSRELLKYFAGRHVLVTGHTGFKGSWLSLWLTRLGARVTGFADAVPTDPSHFDALTLDIDDRRGDISDSSAVDTVVAEAKPEILFHFAAQPLVRQAYSDPLQTYRTNVLGTLAVLEAARRHEVRSIVVATTDKVYRNTESGRRHAETDEIGGSDPYSASKSCVELLVRSYRESFVRDGPMLVATVRAGNVIGGGDWAEDRLVPDLMRAAFGDNAALIRNPESTRPWQHVLDVLLGYMMVAVRLAQGDRGTADAWNLGPLSNSSISVRDVVDAVRAQIPGLNVEFRTDESGLHESGLLQLDSTKAMTRLGWRPRWEGELLERTIDWYREFHEGGRAISNEQLSAYESALT